MPTGGTPIVSRSARAPITEKVTRMSVLKMQTLKARTPASRVAVISLTSSGSGCCGPVKQN